MYERWKEYKKIEVNGESYLETNKDVSRVYWVEGFGDNSSTHIHQ